MPEAEATFDTRSFVLDIACQQRRRWEQTPSMRISAQCSARRLKVDKLSQDIKPEECKVRVEAAAFMHGSWAPNLGQETDVGN